MSSPNELHTRRLAEKSYELGAPAMLHMLREVERGASVEDVLERYARLPVAFVKANNGDRFAPSLISVEGGRR